VKYDPEHAPDPGEWLELDESERIDLALRYHRRARVELPNAKMHAIIHSVVETQVAMGDELPVASTVRRLEEEGLDRHDAIHAVGSVLAQYLFELSKGEAAAEFSNEAYRIDLGRLNAKEWRRAR
jgi:hypothetical protein